MKHPFVIPPFVQEYEPLSAHTTFRIGGPTRYFVEVKNESTLKDALAWAIGNDLPIKALGAGSNILACDAGYDGVVLHMATAGITSKVIGDTVEVTAAAGELWDALVARCVEEGWWGIENLSLIPGTVGAFAVQNVGAYGVEATDVVVQVEALHIPTSTIHVFTNEACQFQYRHSFFKTEQGRSYIITSVTLQLSRVPKPNIQYKDVKEYFSQRSAAPDLRSIREAIIAIRTKKFPDMRTVGTAGSFFKNPVVTKKEKDRITALYPEAVVYQVNETDFKLSAAWLIDNVLNLKGARVGNVGTYSEQALVVVNYNDATAREMIAFVTMMQTMLKEKINVLLEWEVELW